MDHRFYRVVIKWRIFKRINRWFYWFGIYRHDVDPDFYDIPKKHKYFPRKTFKFLTITLKFLEFFYQTYDSYFAKKFPSELEKHWQKIKKEHLFRDRKEMLYYMSDEAKKGLGVH